MSKTILITGAGSGIGRATARSFLGAGWRVALVGRRQAPLEETAEGHRDALVLPFDVSDEDAVAQGFAEVATDWGRLDVLFNNAGVAIGSQMIDEVDVSEWRSLLDINVHGMFLCARAAFGLMRRQDPQGGRIINNGSISAHVPRYGAAPYTVSKHAITGLTRSLCLDGRAFDIACGQIDIGNAETEIAERMSRGVPQADGSIREEPMMDPSHVAASVLHMASLPLSANVPFMTVMATKMPYIGRG